MIDKHLLRAVLPGIFLLFAAGADAQDRLPILDMHMHARTAAFYGPSPLPMRAG